MPVSKDLEAYVVDQLSEAGAVDSRRMFGGVGLYLDGVFCALIASTGRFYLRVDDSNRPEFEAEGMGPFRPRSTGAGMPYYEVPAHVLEAPDELARWAARARAAALAAKRSGRKSGGRPRRRR